MTRKRGGKESDPNGIRTRVTAVKGRCPRPLDDRVFEGERNMAGRTDRAREKKAGVTGVQELQNERATFQSADRISFAAALRCSNHPPCLI